MIQVEINGKKITLSENKTILEAALEADIYIPHLCYYPGLSSPRQLHPTDKIYQNKQEIKNEGLIEYEGCNLCLVQIEGRREYYHSCTTVLEEGMKIYTETEEVKEERKKQIIHLLKNHPHICLFCDFAVGCDRKICSRNTADQERCCWKYGNCEFQELVNYLEIDNDIEYDSNIISEVEDHIVFTKDIGLCINCLRCISACHEIAERNALGYIHNQGKYSVGWIDETAQKSRCKFCLVCVDVCPTGSLKEKKPKREKTKIRLKINSPKLPPQKKELFLLDQESLARVPEKEGIYILYDEKGTILQITGTENLNRALGGELKNKENQRIFFNFEVDQMFTMRERQLIQQHLQKYKDLPVRNREIDDLF